MSIYVYIYIYIYIYIYKYIISYLIFSMIIVTRLFGILLNDNAAFCFPIKNNFFF